ncbi:MAG: nucleoside-diphosphate kinase [Candidatus Comchoanobacterales bacterium]
MLQQTLSIIKPDAVERNLIGSIISVFEKNGLTVKGLHYKHLTMEEAGQFYAVHKERPFYQELVEYMCSGPVVVMILEGDNAIEMNRKLMGATNPKDAEEGTIRQMFALSIDKNSVHGSDANETAKEEIAFFFDKDHA